MRVIKVSHDNFVGVEINVQRRHHGSEPINSKPRRVTKSLRGSLKPTNEIELVGSFREQCNQIRDINKNSKQNFVITISQDNPIRSTAKPKEVWRPVTKRERGINRMADIKILRELWNAKRNK